MTLQDIIFLMSLFYCKVDSLTCYKCVPEASLNCTETQTECPTGQCGSLRTTSYVGGTKSVDMLMKNCTMPSDCFTASVNFGITRTVISRRCCNTNLCNNQSVSELSNNTPNGRKCFTCNGENCLSTLTCMGDEDHCIKTTVVSDGQRMTLRGCASRTFCKTDLSPHISQLNMVVDFTCCRGNLCNGATRTVEHLLLLSGIFSLILLVH